MASPSTLLVDNGSLEPAATLGLRALAGKLAARLGEPVEPVSLLHASGVAPEKLGGQSAEILEPGLDRRLREGRNDFLILPLFFGPSGALTDYLPGRLVHLRNKHPHLRAQVAAPLFQPSDGRLAQILADQVKRTGRAAPRVVLVDHGSPARGVSDVRNALAGQLGNLLGPECHVAPASMERRPGPEYDFCEPLLADLLRRDGWNAGEIVVAMQFLLPGRHAGPGGDVATICREAEKAGGGRLQVTMTGLVAEHPLLVEVLADRWQAARSGN